VNIYSQKQRWKLLLAGAALIIVVVSLWYTNILVRKIADEEREKVQLWAEAIQNKAALVSYTGELFEKISNEERNKIEIWAGAYERVAISNNDNDLDFFLHIIEKNTTIPLIFVKDGEITESSNFDIEEGIDSATYIAEQLELIKKGDKDPIALEFKIPEIPGYSYKLKLYYKNSKIFSELKLVLDDLIESFISEIVINSASVPVIYTDSTQQKVLEFGNLDSNKIRQEN